MAAVAAVAVVVRRCSAREAAPVDFTGDWVSVITEDWRWRMVTPARGDFAGIPLNQEGRRVGDAWDPDEVEAADAECRAYGAGGIMRAPTRLHIVWEDDETLRIDTDAGMQTRLFNFGGERPADWVPTFQGYSSARWEPAVRGTGTPRAGLGAVRVGSGGRALEVVTTGLACGLFEEERCALQRRCGGARILQPVQSCPAATHGSS